ncbi:MAG TPA: translocation/assembly module TamB domain-containing protein [Burkholderiales bacterium]|nr:translocation/assembly module TamB domain-containing protein [Burkholderiales bacterium]
MKALKVFSVVVLAVVAMLALAGFLLVGTEAGLRWASRYIPPEVTVENLRGALLRDIRFDRLVYEREGTRVVARDGRVRLELLSFLGRRAGIRYAEIDEVVVFTQKTDKPAETLELPVGIRIEQARVKRLEVQGVELADFRLADAALLPSGVAANAAFSLPAYQAAVELRVSGALERFEVAARGTWRAIPASARLLVVNRADIEAMEVDAGPVDLRALDAALPRTSLDIGVRGTPRAGRVTVANRDPGPLDKERIPLSALQSRFETDFTTLELRELQLMLAPGGSLSGAAHITREETFLDVQAAGLDLRAFRTSLRQTALSGRLRILATREVQSLVGTLAQPGMQVSADLDRRGEQVDIRSLHALAAGGELRGQGTLHTGRMTVDATAQLSRFDPARFGDFPRGILSGKVSAKGALGGAIDARWDIAGRLLDEPLATRGAARISRERIAQASVEARLGEKQLAARGDFGRAGDTLRWDYAARGLRATGTLTGSLAKHQVEFNVRARDIDTQAVLAGAWRGPQGWSGEIRALRNAGRYPLRLAAPAPLALARGKVDLGRVEAELGTGRLRIAQLSWTPQRLASSGSFTGLPAHWLIAAGGLAEKLKSTLLLDGEWSLAAAPRLTGTASLRRASGDLTVVAETSLALGLERGVVDARFADGRVDFAADVAGRFAAAKAKGQVSPEPNAPGFGITPASAVSVDALVSFVELRALTRGLVADARVDGRLGGELRVGGTLGAPSFGGTLRGEALAMDLPQYGVYLKNGSLRARLDGDALVLDEFVVHGGEGRFTAQGRVSLTAKADARVTWRAERLSVLERPDMRLVATGSGEAALAEGRVSLVGELRADRGFLDLEQERLPRLGDDVVIAGQPRAPGKARARLPAGQLLALDLALDLGEQLQVRGYGLEGRLAGRLELQTSRDGELRAYGRVQTVNATLFAYGQRLQVDPGIAVFDGPLDNPSLQMIAWRRNQAVEAGVQVTGNARSPRVQVVSQPPVPEGERLSWLVLGRAPADATKADLGMLQAAAGALLSRGSDAPLDRRIARAFGLDELTVRGTGEVAQQVVAVGKRLSDRLYVSFEQGIGAAATALVKLDFSLTQRVSLRAETGTSSGLGLFYRFSWD